jgi:hypothetical protein
VSEELTAARIEPGQEFEVAYGDGRSVTVVALGLRKQRELAAIVRKLMELEGDPKKSIQLFDHAEDAIRMAIPNVTDEYLDTIDAESAIEIAGACLGKQSLSEDEQKK